jgi:hypothetical protein
MLKATKPYCFHHLVVIRKSNEKNPIWAICLALAVDLNLESLKGYLKAGITVETNTLLSSPEALPPHAANPGQIQDGLPYVQKRSDIISGLIQVKRGAHFLTYALYFSSNI